MNLHIIINFPFNNDDNGHDHVHNAHDDYNGGDYALYDGSKRFQSKAQLQILQVLLHIHSLVGMDDKVVGQELVELEQVERTQECCRRLQVEQQVEQRVELERNVVNREWKT